MFSQLKKLFKILNTEQKTRFFTLSLLMTITGIFEIISVISLVEFVSFLSSGLTNNGYGAITKFLDFINYDKTLTLHNLSFFIIAILVITACLNLYNIILTAKFSSKTGGELESKLFNYYLKRDYIHHLNSNSSNLLNNIFELVPRVSNFVLAPLMLIFSKIIFLVPFLIGLSIFKPEITLIALIIFLSLYFILFKLFKNKLTYLGTTQNLITKEKFITLQEGFGSIREIKIFNKFNIFRVNYFNLYNRLVKIEVLREIIGKFPRYFVEVITFITSIILILYLNKNLNFTFEKVIISISFFLICAYKIIPAFQQVYYLMTHLKNHLPALDEIYDDLSNSVSFENGKFIAQKEFFGKKFKKIEIKNLNFNYQKRKYRVLEDISLEIKDGEKVAITGLSGSGKTTFIHILLGLIKQSNGKILVNNKELKNSNLHCWQEFIGFVPQSIYLTDKSIKANIAFGITEEEINETKVSELVSLTKLSNLVHGLPDKENTKIGERGVQFSGGQQQRIGIARALYKNPEVIILDEATNSLDILTEHEIIDSLVKFNKNATIFMITHRLEVIKKFDKIIFLENGKLEGFGSFKDLSKNKNFRNMLNLNFNETKI
tara:strand:+ start:2008 stop:3819 length:1812 start_codon:yes stop_codon:yes gene_type:complete